MKYSETPGTEKQNLKIFGAKLFASSFVLCPSARAGRNFKVGGPFTSRMTGVQDNRENAQNFLHTCEKNSFKVTFTKCKS